MVSLMLSICISVDSASNETITVNNTTLDFNDSFIEVNGSFYSSEKDIGVAKFHKVVTEKTKIPIITCYGKPTCYTCWKNHRKYQWYKKSYINYCPNCKRYGTLRNNPKRVKDGEITCSRCDCDFCVYCGRDKVESGGRHNWNILRGLK